MALQASKINVGDTYEEQIVDNLTRTQIVQWAGTSGDTNPLHTDEPYATKVAGFPTVFAPGLLTQSMTGKAVTNYVGDGRVTKFGARFSTQVYPGDTLNATCTVKEIREENGQYYVELDVLTTNQKRENVIKGYATARIDP